MKSRDPQHRWAALRLLRDHVSEHIRRTNVILHAEPQTFAPLAQIIAFLHMRLGQSALIYYRTAQQRRSAATILAGVGLRAMEGINTEPKFVGASSFNSRDVDILVCVSGETPRSLRRDIRFVLHASIPSSIEAFLLDLKSVGSYAPTRENVMFYRERHDHEDTTMMRYCRDWTCRHAQIVRLSRPELANPEPREFACYHCDVCLSQARACYGDVDDAITCAPRSGPARESGA